MGAYRNFYSFIVGHNILWENKRKMSLEPKNGPKLPTVCSSFCFFPTIVYMSSFNASLPYVVTHASLPRSAAQNQ